MAEVSVYQASGEKSSMAKLANIDDYDGLSSYSADAGFRPVFKLKEGLKIIAGNGTETSPYIISM